MRHERRLPDLDDVILFRLGRGFQKRQFAVFKDDEAMGIAARLSQREFRSKSVLTIVFVEDWIPIGCTEYSMDMLENPIERELAAKCGGEFVGHSQRLKGPVETVHHFLVKDEHVQEAFEIVRYRLEKLGAPASTEVKLTPKPGQDNVEWRDKL